MRIASNLNIAHLGLRVRYGSRAALEPPVITAL
jgi:hypothetical protein